MDPQQQTDTEKHKKEEVDHVKNKYIHLYSPNTW